MDNEPMQPGTTPPLPELDPDPAFLLGVLLDVNARVVELERELAGLAALEGRVTALELHLVRAREALAVARARGFLL